MQLWDIAGQERFSSMTHVYYKDAVGALVVFDVTRGVTMSAAQNWRVDLEEKVLLPNGNPVPVVLCANKCDMPASQWAVSAEEIADFSQRNNFDAHFLTSALSDTNLSETIDTLVHRVFELVEYKTLLAQAPKGTDSITIRSSGTDSAPSCCRSGT